MPPISAVWPLILSPWRRATSRPPPPPRPPPSASASASSVAAPLPAGGPGGSGGGRFSWLTAPPIFSNSNSIVLTSRYVIGLLAFLICIDMTQVLGVLCYQLFLGSYFPWHLYPLMLNRAIELLALLCSDGHVPCVYSIAQIFLTILSMVICIQKQPCGRFNCIAALVLYGLLLIYQIFVAGMVVRISKVTIITEDEAQSNLNWVQDMESQRQMNDQTTPNENDDPSSKEYDDFIIAIQQPGGEKYAIGKICKDTLHIHPNTSEGTSECSTSHQPEASTSGSNQHNNREEEIEERAFLENMTKEIIELLIEGSTKASSTKGSTKARSLEVSNKARPLEVSNKERSIDGSKKARSIDGSNKARSIDGSNKARSIDGSIRSISREGSTRSRSIDGSIRSISRQGSTRSRSKASLKRPFKQ